MRARLCKECGASESEQVPFPTKGLLCKKCRTVYDREYQRVRRGSQPRTKMSPEQKRLHDNERHRSWMKNNPEKAKAIRRRAYQKGKDSLSS